MHCVMVTLSLKNSTWILMSCIMFVAYTNSKKHPNDYHPKFNSARQKNHIPIRNKRSDFYVVNKSISGSPYLKAASKMNTTLANIYMTKSTESSIINSTKTNQTTHKTEQSLDDLSQLFSDVSAYENVKKQRPTLKEASKKFFVENLNLSEIFNNSADEYSTHVRVKRNHPEMNQAPLSLTAEYLQRLADSFSSNTEQEITSDGQVVKNYNPLKIPEKKNIRLITSGNRKTKSNDEDSLSLNQLNDVDDEISATNVARTKRYSSFIPHPTRHQFQIARYAKKLDFLNKVREKRQPTSPSLLDIKNLAQNIIVKVDQLQDVIRTGYMRLNRDSQSISPDSSYDGDVNPATAINSVSGSIDHCAKFMRKKKRKRRCKDTNNSKKNMIHKKWAKWTEWSSCSVTCGKGRQIRWRHCRRDCNTAEMEMEEKSCQLPACAPTNIFGIFNKYLL